MTDVGSEALDMLDVGEVATRLRLSPATIWRYIYAEVKVPGTGLVSVKAGRRRLVAPEAVADFKAKLREQGSIPSPVDRDVA